MFISFFFRTFAEDITEMLSNFHLTKLPLLAVLLLLPLSACVSTRSRQTQKTDERLNSENIVRLRIIGMSDLHGNFLPYDHLNKRPAVGGLPFVYSFVRDQRKDTTQHVVFLNSGDMLQGSMASYYYNYIDKREQFMPAVLMGRMRVDATVFGNHDLEPGREKMDEFIRISNEVNSAVLAGNLVARGTRRRVMRPYTIVERDDLRIAVIGLTTPILTGCAKTDITPGYDVLDMLEQARYWMRRIRATEDPDLVIGLFHAGFLDYTKVDTTLDCTKANDPMYIARHVPGFDAFILGHGHNLKIEDIYVEGRRIWLVEPGYGGKHVGIIDFEFERNPDATFTILNSSAKIESVSEIKLSQDLLGEFAEEVALISAAADEIVAAMNDTIRSIEAYFGSSFFVDITHKVQLAADTLADISFASPLSARIRFTPGNITYSDLLRIYRYENRLTPLRMTGEEIKGYLEYSYGLWVNTMQSRYDNLLRLTDPGSHFVFQIPAFNFDSGAGLDYEVDVTKPVGERITILRLWNGREFHADSNYRVVANSYRVGGAGGHMELGAGITPEQMHNRIIRFNVVRDEGETVGRQEALQLLDIQVRELIRREFDLEREVVNFRYDNWRFVPDDIVIPARKREIEILRERLRLEVY